MRHIIYISVDGILEPLGESQVRRILEGLSADGRQRFTLFTLEKSNNLEDVTRVRACKKALAEKNIEWHYYPYQSDFQGIAKNLVILTQAIGELVERDPCSLVHARSYLAGTVADMIWLAYQTPYVFDFRGYWIDERIEEKRWFTNPISIASARIVERRLFQNASGIVSLANPAADDIRNGRFGDMHGKPIVVIPTCVDDSIFSMAHRSTARPAHLKGKTIIAYVGSLNASYMIDESLHWVAHLLESDPKMFFLGLTSQTQRLRRAALRADIPMDRMEIRSVAHDEMPEWLGRIDWGLLLLNSNVAKRGSMPTKLGEFVAAGIRPIHHGCNEDVTYWVEQAGTGISVAQVTDVEMHDVADVLSHADDLPSVEGGWKRVREHFGLESGIRRYQALYDAICTND